MICSCAVFPAVSVTTAVQAPLRSLRTEKVGCADPGESDAHLWPVILALYGLLKGRPTSVSVAVNVAVCPIARNERGPFEMPLANEAVQDKTQNVRPGAPGACEATGGVGDEVDSASASSVLKVKSNVMIAKAALLTSRIAFHRVK
jgi:hypothetical protein